jgi:hypothetical protein
MTTIREWTDQIRDLNIAKGWRPAEGGPGNNTWGDYLALLHTEISEILENYRDRRLATYTTATGKPDDVGSEVADCVIRLLDMCDVFKVAVFDLDMDLADVSPRAPLGLTDPYSFGDWVAWLHFQASAMWPLEPLQAPLMLRSLMGFADRWGIVVEFEVERKVRYNRTRPYQHGGRTVADGATA